MRPKLIATDLDRTLLRTDRTISPYTAGVFARLQGAGIPIVFATARSHHNIANILSIIPADGIIGNGGAIVTFGKTEVYRALMDIEITNEILRRLSKSPDCGYISAENDKAYFYDDPTTEHRAWAKTLTLGFPKFWDFSQMLTAPAHKITAQIDHKAAADLVADMPDVGVLGFFDEPWTRFAHINATKWRALAALAEYLKIDPAHIAAFGDDYNDIEMLENTGISVAVANAIPKAIAAAKYACDSNDNDGVAKWLGHKYNFYEYE